MLRSHNPQDVELDFFTLFLTHAIKGEGAYIDIVKPIILDAASLARNDKKIAEIDRSGLNIKLILVDWGATNIATVNAGNLTQNLSLILDIINDRRNTATA